MKLQIIEAAHSTANPDLNLGKSIVNANTRRRQSLNLSKLIQHWITTLDGLVCVLYVCPEQSIGGRLMTMLNGTEGDCRDIA